MKKYNRYCLGVFFLIVMACLILSLSIASGAFAENTEVAPVVSITSPQNGAIVYEDSVSVVINFGPKEMGEGNVRTIKLRLDGELVATRDNPANIKEGIHTFILDIANLPDGEHTLQAFAYQAEERAMHEGSSEVVTFTFTTVARQITEMEENFDSGDFEGLCTSAETLKEFGEAATPVLVDTFQDKNEDIIFRKMIAEIIGEIGDSSAVYPLIEVMEDTTEIAWLRAEAAFTLGMIGDERALSSLITALDDVDEEIRSSAALALGLLENSDAVIPLIEKLSDETRTMRVRTISALGMLGDPRAVEPLIALLADEHELIASAAIISLGMLADDRAIEPLLNILQTKSGLRQVNAMKALGQIKDGRAVDDLILFLRGENEYLVMNAGMALAEIGDPRAVTPIAEAIERVSDEFAKTKLKEAYKTLTGEVYS